MLILHVRFHFPPQFFFPARWNLAGASSLSTCPKPQSEIENEDISLRHQEQLWGYYSRPPYNF